MNKLKFIKSLVFLLTFVIVFLLCLALTKVIRTNHNPSYEIDLGLSDKVKIEQIYTSGTKLYLRTDEQNVYIINLKTGKKEGIIYLSGSKSNGKKE